MESSGKEEGENVIGQAISRGGSGGRNRSYQEQVGRKGGSAGEGGREKEKRKKAVRQPSQSQHLSSRRSVGSRIQPSLFVDH